MRTKETLYNTYVAAQKNNLKEVALYTRDGEAVTHGRLLDEIDREIAESLLAFKSNDNFKVGILSSSSYEEAVFACCQQNRSSFQIY